MPASLRALLTDSLDYAGMFPPCSLDLERAMKNQAQYVRSADAWMLSTLVLPVAQFNTAKTMLSEFDLEHSLRISALGPKVDNAAAFSQELAKVNKAIGSISAYDVDLVSVSQLEMALPEDVDLARLR